jgi:exodeoxyribonuclease V alpha subunit
MPSGRLYLRRWWEHEAALAGDLSARARTVLAYDQDLLAEGLARLFPPRDDLAGRGSRDQAEAAARAVRQGLTVITGGPGTGKTTTVVRCLALIAEQALAAGAATPRMALLAPTGKAAARMGEAVAASRERLETTDAVRQAIPAAGKTLHRALGTRRDGTWVHTSANPLDADVVVVDEASMIDVALLRGLTDAVRPDARLVILGDRDQLASVDAGAVLADLCGAAPAPLGGDPIRGAPDEIRAAPPLAGCIAVLSHSFRFGQDSGVGLLARSVLAGDADSAIGVLRDGAFADVGLVGARPTDRAGRLHPRLTDLVVDGYGAYLAALGAGRGGDAAAGIDDVTRALAALGRFRVLCGHRRGPLGAGYVGSAVVETLSRLGRLAAAGDHWHGRPVIVSRNDYSVNLFNGDVGLIARVDDGGDGGSGNAGGMLPEAPRGAPRLRAFFPGDGPKVRELSPARLPPHDTVFAMSIHRSQGSEFDAVAVVLPEEGSPLLSRELLYTAVTRARRSVTVFGSEEALRTALSRRVERASGLRARLWGD